MYVYYVYYIFTYIIIYYICTVAMMGDTFSRISDDADKQWNLEVRLFMFFFSRKDVCIQNNVLHTVGKDYSFHSKRNC